MRMGGWAEKKDRGGGVKEQGEAVNKRGWKENWKEKKKLRN